MKGFRKMKMLSLALSVIAAVGLNPITARALNYDLTDGAIINSYNVTSDVVTLYVGNVSVDGTSQLKYLYTDKSVNTGTLTEIGKILTSDYAALLPATEGQVKVCNDSSVTVNDVFTDAGLVAANKYTGTVSDTSSTILYDETQFNSLVTASQTEVSDEATAETNNLAAWNTRKTTWESEEQEKVDAAPNYTPVPFPEDYVNAFNDSTTYPTDSYFIADNKGTSETDYIIRNDVAARVDTYPISRTIIKVVNTSANVTSPVVTPTKIDTLNISVASPKAGDMATAATKPSVTIDSNPNYEIDYIAYITAYPSEKSAGEYDATFTGTFETGKDYVVEVGLVAKDGYVFADNDGMTLKVNDKTTGFEMNKWNADGSPYYMFFTKVQASAQEESAPEEQPAAQDDDDDDDDDDDSVAYTILEGANQTHIARSGQDLVVRASGEFSKFTGIKVDGQTVSADNYTAVSGSTIVTLKAAYLDTLSEGTHTLTIAFSDGEVSTNFTTAKTAASPKTGEAHAELYAFYMALAAMVFAGLYGMKKSASKESR